MVQHPDLELSLYLDDALPTEERRQLEAHLAGCAACRSRLAELRGVARLVAALPERAPRRSLLPRRHALPSWLVPARWVSTLASAVFVLAFVATNLTFIGPSASPAFAPIGNNLSSEASSGAAKLASASPAPAPASALPYGDYATASGERSATTTDSRATVQPRGPAVSGEPVATATSDQGTQAPRWLWLVPAALFAIVALGLQWRIRQVG
jgi:anti-sigma factor RsiW